MTAKQIDGLLSILDRAVKVAEPEFTRPQELWGKDSDARDVQRAVGEN